MRPAGEGNEALSPADGDVHGALHQAEATLEEYKAEVERLRGQLANRSTFDDLRDAFALAAATGALLSPVSHSQLLTMIVQTAGEVMGAESALLLLLDAERDDLVSEIARGVDEEDVEELRIPLGHGIAGLVAATGQPMAVTNAAEDSRVAPEIVACLDYYPNSILCVPLVYGERVIGVLEVLERDPGRSFSARDGELLAQFARQAAVAIAHSRAYRSVLSLGSALLGPNGTAAGPRVEELASTVENDRQFAETVRLAETVRSIASAGEDEAKACREILTAFAAYISSRPPLRGDGL
jgi:GAF domain-containing protein